MIVAITIVTSVLLCGWVAERCIRLLLELDEIDGVRR
jgi:hypothetical protein